MIESMDPVELVQLRDYILFPIQQILNQNSKYSVEKYVLQPLNMITLI